MLSPRNLARGALPRRAALAFTMIGALALAGCGGASASPPTGATAQPGVATTAPVAATTAPAPASASASAAGAGSCGGAVASTITQHVASAAISGVTIIGGCHQASIATSLAATDVKAGLAICDSAAEVGYTDGVSSITVDAVDGKELAIGLKDASCIGEP